ncbi:SxtJ family membrane protein [Fuerstiella marisgermanici]|uniref:SxtJ n=1 Tax=Fuerstiella marisgermanici TaxID=1891926 RepID=A0A1P8WNX7_9PLAN|nr:SxtJ family membrane protein [Fuerstiella marisgermanici]APZ95763.1 hypothetical protein Fuma_05425 [Fuerstiella marisgermanici]
MALLHFNLKPSQRQLRQFGAACAVVVPLIVWFWSRSLSATAWAGVAGLLICGVGLIKPRILQPLFVGLTVLAFPIGLVVGEVALLLMFVGVFLPMAVVFRMIGRDALQRRSVGGHETFWQRRPPTPKSGRYFRQF